MTSDLSPESKIILKMLSRPEKWTVTKTHCIPTQGANLIHECGLELNAYPSGEVFAQLDGVCLVIPNCDHEFLKERIIGSIGDIEKRALELQKKKSNDLLASLQSMFDATHRDSSEPLEPWTNVKDRHVPEASDWPHGMGVATMQADISRTTRGFANYAEFHRNVKMLDHRFQWWCFVYVAKPETWPRAYPDVQPFATVDSTSQSP